MILAPRPPFRASRRPPVGRHQGFQQAYRTTISRVLRRALRATVKGVPAKATPPCRFPMSPPVLESQRGSSVRVSELAARLANQPRVGRQAGKPDHGPVSTAIGTKDYLRQYVAPLRLAPEGETTIIMVAVCWEDNPEDLLQRLEEIHRGDQPPRMGEIPGETPGDHINRKKRKRSGARVKAHGHIGKMKTHELLRGFFFGILSS